MSNRIVLSDAPKGYTLDQDKVYPPEETVRRFKERLKEVDLDVLEDTVRIDNGRLDIPVYFSICGKDAEGVIGTKKQMGKGGTSEQAEASAVMELAERFSFFTFYRDRKNFLVEEYRNVRDRAIPFELIAGSVHDNSYNLDIAEEIFSRLRLRWAQGYNLTREEQVLVPIDWFHAINEFNGTSAGNSVEEALIQGICEIVERHVSCVISRNKVKTPGIKVESLSDPTALDMVRKYDRAGIRLFISDFSMDIGIPSVGVLAYDPSTFPERSEIVWTAGTAPDPQKALSRALSEVAQLGGDFDSGSRYVASGLPKLTSLEEADFVIQPDREIEITHLPDLSHNNIRLEVERSISSLYQRDLEIIGVDIANLKLGIPAFYTIVPGTHFRERAANTSVGMVCAKLLAESGDPSESIEELGNMDKLMPGSYYIKFFLGACSLSLNRINEALNRFEEALQLSPHPEDVPSIYSYMGLCLKELEQYRDAIKVLEKAENYDKERTDIYNLMGFCYFKLKEHERAIHCFRKVIGLDPSSAIDYANIASNYRDMDDRENAIEYYELALSLDPTIDFARENLRKLRERTHSSISLFTSS